MRGTAETDGEDHAVAALGYGLFDGGDGKGLSAVADDELGELGVAGDGSEYGLLDTNCVAGAGGDDHQGFLRATLRVVEHQLDYTGDLGIGAFHSTGVGIGHPEPVCNVVEREAAVAEEASGPGQRLDASAIEATVHKLGEVFAACTVTAGQRQGRQHTRELGERRQAVELVG